MEKADPQNILFIDVETSIYNNGHPFDPSNKLVSYVYRLNDNVVFGYYNDPDFISKIRDAVKVATCVCGFNVKFDLHWLANVGVEVPLNCKVWDCQLAEFIYSGQEARFASLSDTYDAYGLSGAKSHTIEEYWAAGISTEDIPVDVVRTRGIGDVVPLAKLYEIQQGLLSEQQKRLVWLEGEDLKALMAAERAGILFDVAKAEKCISECMVAVRDIEADLAKYLPSGIPAGAFNWDSGDHLSAFLYGGKIKFKYVQAISTYKTGNRAGEERRSWSTIETVFPQRFIPIAGTELAKTKAASNPETRFYSTDAHILATLAKQKANRDILSLLKDRAAPAKSPKRFSLRSLRTALASA